MNNNRLTHNNTISKDGDSLELLPVARWIELQEAFKTDWPRGISGYKLLETQQKWIQEGFGYDIKVYCPFGDVWSGMVAINDKDTAYEIIIQCPKDDTKNLEEALKITKIIDWKRRIIIPFVPGHVLDGIQRILADIKMDINVINPKHSFILNKGTPLFENISLPSDTTFGLLSQDHANLVNDAWPHRYPGSVWYFQLLIRTRSGYGLFRNNDLLSWVFINEAGTFGNMFTLDEYRRNGYAELLLKLVCNVLLKDNKDAYMFCVKDNVRACQLYRKVGFEEYSCGVCWCHLKPSNTISNLT